jgi:HEAT repeat protein
MSKPFDDISPDAAVDLQSMTVEDLLYLVSDEDKGFKPEAIDLLFTRGLDDVFPVIDRALRDDHNADLRNGAMEMMVKFGSRAVPKLAELLKDENEEVRIFSTVMLGDIGSRDAVAPLIESLHDPDPNVRHGAAETLGRIGDHAALIPLTDLLKEDFWQQYPAIVALGEMRDNRAVPYLLNLLRDEMLAGTVIEALGKIGDPRALIPLSWVLNNSGGLYMTDAVAAAAKALVAIGTMHNDIEQDKHRPSETNQPLLLKMTINDQGRANLKGMVAAGGDKSATIAAVTLLGWLEELSVIEDLLALLEDPDYHETVEEVLVSFGKAAVPWIQGALAHPSDNVRISVIRCYRSFRLTLETAQVLPLLSDGSEQLKLELLETIRGTTREELLPVLEELLRRDTPAVRAMVLEVVGSFPFASVGAILQRFSSSADPSIRKLAPAVVGLSTGEVDTPLLEPFFIDVAAEVRREAARAAGRKRSAALIPRLLTMLGDCDAEARDQAVFALSEYSAGPHLDTLLRCLGEGDERFQYALLKAVGRIGSGAAGPALVQYLHDKPVSRQLEFITIETLGKLRDTGPSEQQVVTEHLGHADPDIRRQAIRSLERMAGDKALEEIGAACNDPNWSVRIAALLSLVEIAGEGAIPALTEALNDYDPMVKKNAIVCLGKLRCYRSIETLVRLLADAEMGKYAQEALLNFGRLGLPWLHRMLKNPHQPGLRERIIDLIGRIGDRKSIETLIHVLDDPNPSVRLAAVDSLVSCSDSPALKKLMRVKLYDADEEVRTKADLALKMLTMENFC